MKKTLLILLIIFLITIAVALILYLSGFFGLKTTKLSDHKIFFPYINNQANLFNLSETNNDILLNKLDLNNLSENKIFSSLPQNIHEIVYSPKSDQAITNYHNDLSSTDDYVLYYSKTNQSKKLNSNIKKIKWSKIDNKIYYIYTNLESSTDKIVWQFNISDPDGDNWKNVISLENEVINDFWVSNSEKFSILSTIVENDIEISHKYYLVDMIKKTKKELANLDILSLYWSPDDQNVAFRDSSGNLNISDSTFSDISKINLQIDENNLTWIDNNTIALSTLNKIKSNNYTSYFDFYYLNIKNDKLRKIKLDTKSPINNVSRLLIDSSSKTIYYIDNDNLYKIEKSIIKKIIDKG